MRFCWRLCTTGHSDARHQMRSTFDDASPKNIGVRHWKNEKYSSHAHQTHLGLNFSYTARKLIEVGGGLSFSALLEGLISFRRTCPAVKSSAYRRAFLRHHATPLRLRPSLPGQNHGHVSVRRMKSQRTRGAIPSQFWTAFRSSVTAPSVLCAIRWVIERGGH